MAYAEIEFFSQCLNRRVSFKTLLPNDAYGRENNPHFTRKTKLLILLHGYCNRSSEWLLHSKIADLSNQYNICVILPSGENSFYLDGEETGHQYGTFIGKELIEYVKLTFGYDGTREDTYIGGLSMGGFGAIHTALQFPETFGKVCAFSSALIVNGLKDMEPQMDNGMANYAYYRQVFGPLETAATRDTNPEVLIDGLLGNKAQIPEFYIACGTEDFLLENNREFVRFLEGRRVSYTYHESEGSHNFDFWNQYLEKAILWLLGE